MRDAKTRHFTEPRKEAQEVVSRRLEWDGHEGHHLPGAVRHDADFPIHQCSEPRHHGCAQLCVGKSAHVPSDHCISGGLLSAANGVRSPFPLLTFASLAWLAPKRRRPVQPSPFPSQVLAETCELWVIGLPEE